jgi:uncharacterized protein
MTASPVVSNSSPIIALQQIGQLDLLERLYTRLVIPPVVAFEVSPSVELPAWIDQRPLVQTTGSNLLRASLGPGESEAIGLALEVGSRWIILDDRPARRLAQALSIPVIGTPGILLAGKRRGLVDHLRPHLDALIEHGFFIAPGLFDRVIRDAGEAP